METKAKFQIFPPGQSLESLSFQQCNETFAANAFEVFLWSMVFEQHIDAPPSFQGWVLRVPAALLFATILFW
jgi:hypothetical protein